jgi:protein SCO1
MQRTRKAWLRIVLSAIVLSAALLVMVLPTACTNSAPSFKGSVLEPPRSVQDFTLTDHNGNPFRLEEQRGRVLLLFFGYTFCPDVCPTTLGTWTRVHEALGADADKVRFVFVTVDPERDTPERLKQHLAVFNSAFIGLTGSHEELEPVYQDLGVFHEKDSVTESAAGYLVNHTASAFVIDPEGRWRLRHTFGTPVDDIVHDIRNLLK